jgi:hypothetical protein
MIPEVDFLRQSHQTEVDRKTYRLYMQRIFNEFFYLEYCKIRGKKLNQRSIFNTTKNWQGQSDTDTQFYTVDHYAKQWMYHEFVHGLSNVSVQPTPTTYIDTYPSHHTIMLKMNIVMQSNHEQSVHW